MHNQGRSRGREVVGYTAGVFDLFHVGHSRLLANAKGLCDRLIVGVSTDEIAHSKSRPPIVPFEDRLEVVRSCRYVDAAVPQASLDKYAAYLQIGFDVLFVGNDWFGSAAWKTYEKQLGENGVAVIYLPYTRGRSSSEINALIDEERDRRARGQMRRHDASISDARD